MNFVSRIPVLALATGLVALGGITSSASADRTDPTNPLVGKRQFMDCAASHIGGSLKYNPWHFARKYRKYETLIRKTAEVPQVKWFAGIQESRRGRWRTTWPESTTRNGAARAAPPGLTAASPMSDGQNGSPMSDGQNGSPMSDGQNGHLPTQPQPATRTSATIPS